jgi:hypothetical protein
MGWKGFVDPSAAASDIDASFTLDAALHAKRKADPGAACRRLRHHL